MRKTFFAAALSAAAIAVIVPTIASATDTSIVRVPACIGGGGSTTVPAGTDVVARFGWAAGTHGLVEDALRGTTSSLSVNGGPAIDLGPYFGPIVENGSGFVSFAFYDTGIVLQQGQSATLTLDSVLLHPAPDRLGFVSDDSGRPIVYQPGTVIAGTCTVTGV